MSEDQTIGFNTPLGITDFPLTRASLCVQETPSYDFTGAWLQACRVDALSNFDVVALYNISANGDYVATRLLYDLGSGCPINGSSLAIKIFECGHVCILTKSTFEHKT